jgi:hypothetical protein
MLEAPFTGTEFSRVDLHVSAQHAYIDDQLIGAAVTASTLCQILDRIMPRKLLQVAASTLRHEYFKIVSLEGERDQVSQHGGMAHASNVC